MYELAQSQIARAVDVLKNGPMQARVFAEKMWPGRHEGKPGKQSKAGHAVLHRLAVVGFVEKAGDLWLLRGFSRSLADGSAVQSATAPAFGLPMQSPMGPPTGSPVGLPTQPPTGSPIGPPDEQLERQRLQQLVGLADEPVPSVSHDGVYGDVRIRGHFVDDCLAEACAFAVLRGRALNVYPQTGPMLVALTPIEGGRTLYVRWRQSGIPLEPPYRGGTRWIFLEDGVAAAPGAWRPAGAGRQWVEEPCLERIARQRAEAGLGPAVGR